MTKLKNSIHFILLLGVLSACKSEPAKETEDTSAEGTPVTVTTVTSGRMAETVELNAVSSFLLKTYVKANASGYLQAVNTQLGKQVSKGQILFVLKTKEAQILGNTINVLDSTLHFSGTICIKSPGNGYITQLTYRAGDYVQDGEQLAIISDASSFVFLLDLPYELKPFLSYNKNLQLRLPDGSVLNGTIDSAMPTVDAVSQTQSYRIKVNSKSPIPENLVAKVGLVKNVKTNTISLPKSAVLSDEMQRQFWIMKMINSNTAVKVPVQKGMESVDQVEIISPKLSATDKILLTGNYGLSDTTKVVVIK